MIGRHSRLVSVFILGYTIWLCGVLSVSAQEPAVGGSVSVRPFTNISGQSTDDWIGSGFAEVVAVDLSKLGRSVVGGEGEREGWTEKDVTGSRGGGALF